MNFKTHAPARREGTTLQPNIHNVPRTVLFEPGMIDAVRAPPLGELFRPGNLVN